MANKKYTFTRDADHIYRDQDGEIYLSVTQQLHLSGGLIDFSMVDPYILARACERGTLTHDAMYIYHTEELDMESLDPLYAKYVQACISFFENNKFETWDAEFVVYDPILRTAGSPDWLGKLNGKLTLLDYKSGITSKATILQLSAYRRLWEKSGKSKHSIKQLMELKLNADGTYRQIPHQISARHEGIFASMCRTNWFKLSIGVLPPGATGNTELTKLCRTIMKGKV